jgi:hypothetical protein
LNYIQNCALRICTGAFKTTLIEALHAKTATMSLNLQFLAAKWAIKIILDMEHHSFLVLQESNMLFWEKITPPVIVQAVDAIKHYTGEVGDKSHVKSLSNSKNLFLW